MLTIHLLHHPYRFLKIQNLETDEKEKDITIPPKPKNQAFFTVDPNQFNPRGLVKKIYVSPGTGKNGGVIKWEMPGTHIAIFEWNEDFKFGSHLLVEWDSAHNGNHYWPGTPVPEPWNTTYFGG